MRQATVLLEVDRQKSALNLNSGRGYTPFGYRQAYFSLMGFTGQLCERGLGAYALGNGHRFYNPWLMRFHSPDALSPFSQGGINAYAYCALDPINHVDPNGRWLYTVAKNNLVTAKIFMEGIYVGQKLVKRYITGSEEGWYEPRKVGEYVSYAFKGAAVALSAMSELISNLPGPTTPKEQDSYDRLMSAADNLKGAAAVLSLGATGIEILIASVDIYKTVQKNGRVDVRREADMLRQAEQNDDLLNRL
ncbi:RHS repeat-associated core domain-containing protein [Pseudomonas mosselii]|uniref:RHS repeat-associated core domain-containing protein n=1 Tax=Pseudomonas mosselii TaxID=78327 RepID=UPI0018D5F85C|nr:RHS repeat-associated core domain-containing protein [Pseudomonas mosselii]MBH3308295.1 RHS repeat-associated core domain-containing protein [Pseudomonas mosselii]MBH3323477.1 RHS repeat-associated core domain-containing protein [Pseudomonas mosselii]